MKEARFEDKLLLTPLALIVKALDNTNGHSALKL